MHIVFCAVETDEQFNINKQLDSSALKRIANSSSGSKPVSVSSIPSEHAASSNYDVDTDVCTTRKVPEVSGTQLAHKLPQHAANRVDQLSLKSCSTTTSQPSTVAEKFVLHSYFIYSYFYFNEIWYTVS